MTHWLHANLGVVCIVAGFLGYAAAWIVEAFRK